MSVSSLHYPIRRPHNRYQLSLPPPASGRRIEMLLVYEKYGQKALQTKRRTKMQVKRGKRIKAWFTLLPHLQRRRSSYALKCVQNHCKEEWFTASLYLLYAFSHGNPYGGRYLCVTSR
jgi:hypothetical protein